MYSIEFSPDQTLKHSLPPHGISAQFFSAMHVAFGLDPTDRLRHFTYGACDLSRIVDDCIDFPDRPTPETFDSLLEGLELSTIKDMSPREADRALRFVGSLNEEQLAYAREKYVEAVEVAQLRSEAATIAEYGSAIQREAAVQRAVLMVDEDESRRDVESRKKYNQWLGPFILAGYYVDAAVDLGQDSQAGRIRLTPTTLARMQLLAKSIPQLKETVRRMPGRTGLSLASLLISWSIPSLKASFD